MTDDTRDIHALRRQKLDKLREAGDAYPNDFRRRHTAGELHRKYDDKSADELTALNVKTAVAGRLMLHRRMGKAAFFTVQETTGDIQIYANNKSMTAEDFAATDDLDLGDIIGCEGILFKTKTGELTVRATSIRLLVKSLHPPPDKYHGLKDTQTRYRRRYVSLMSNPKEREVFAERARIIRFIRDFFYARDYLEMESPILQPIPGGAAAKPFKTHCNALSSDFYLRIAQELYVKRLLVGGFDRVFELSKNFRNEGVSPRHNPEFTMLEWNAAYQNCEDFIGLTEELLNTLVVELTGGDTITYQGQEISFKRPFIRVSPVQALLEYNPSFSAEQINDRDFLLTRLHAREGKKAARADSLTLLELQLLLFDKTTEHHLIQPTFLIDYPAAASPLARRSPGNPEKAERFELFIAGRELVNGFSELNDPDIQAVIFRDQADRKKAGDEEAMHYDADYIHALECGLPPNAGGGIGIDRLVMLLTDQAAIRDVILFPQMRKDNKGKVDKQQQEAPIQGYAEAQYNLGVMYDKGYDVPEDKSKAVKLYREAAQQGVAEAQHNLGWMYFNGYGVSEDKSEALKWYRKAAAQGDIRAQNNLGMMYFNGDGVPEDKSEAMEWFQKATKCGDGKAQYNLGMMYFNGYGVPEDKSEALKWFQRAAEQGIAEAQHNLGVIYHHGEGAPKDKNEALKWYQEAAKQGVAKAQYNLGVMYFNGDGVSEDKTEALRWYKKAAKQEDKLAQYNLGVMHAKGYGVPENRREAVKWYQKAAAQGYALAQNNLGSMYANGYGVPVDKNEALKWYQKAAAQDHAEAQHNLGLMYYIGDGVPENHREAFKWYQKAAIRENASAQNSLGTMYRNGDGVPENHREALRWYKNAAEQGYAAAQYNLGWMYANGYGVSEDKGEAFKWWQKAAAQGYAEAQYSLGLMYFNGDGVPEDKSEALKWYKKAAMQGYTDAQYNLGWMYYTGEEGVPQDYQEAHIWFELVVASGNKDALEVMEKAATHLSPDELRVAKNEAKKRFQEIESRKY